MKRGRDAMPTHYEIPWATEMIRDRLYVGPFLRDQYDAIYVMRTMQATHVVNMAPPTTEVTKKEGLPLDTWYVDKHWEQHFDPSQDRMPEVVRLPIPDPASDGALEKIKAAKKLEFYKGVARRVADILSAEKDACVYIHQKTGFDEEAMVGFLAWHMYDRASCPKDVSVWCVEKHYERLLNSEPQRTLINGALKELNALNHQFLAWLRPKDGKKIKK